MPKKKPESKTSGSPKNDTPSEKRIFPSEETVEPPLSSKEKSPSKIKANDPETIEGPKTKSEGSATPPMHLEDSGDWAEESKFLLTSSTAHDETIDERPVVLPAAYGYSRLVFLIRDPHWIFAFWEIPPENAHDLLARFQCSWDEVHWVLRMYTPNKENALDDNTWDTAIDPAATGWYLHLSPPGATFQGEIGLCDENGRFEGLMCSNIATLPPDRPSPFVDVQWPISESDHETHYAGLPVAFQKIETPLAQPGMVDHWQVGGPSSRPNPFRNR